MIDLQPESLPFIDLHSTEVAATIEQTWAALIATINASGRSRRGRAIATRLGCVPSESRGDAEEIGSTIPGFMVSRSVGPAVLVLMGRHRYSRYALIFRIGETLDGPVTISAETRAEFPGRRGRIYRALVIGSRGHVLATRWILRGVRRRAERSKP